MIKFLVKGQDIETLEHEVIAADQVSFVNIKFAFDNNWRPLHKVVKFTQECDEYFRVLGVEDTSCYLPAELHAGAVKMSLFGYDTSSEETVRATTVVHTLHVRPSGFENEGNTPVPPTPDLYQQLLQQIGETTSGSNGKSAFEIAVEHGFTGTEKQWLESLKGVNGENGMNGENGADGKSAFDIAVEHGFTGTEEEWLNEMTPDMGNYYNKTEVSLLIERKIKPTQEKAHVHENKEILDGITAEDFSMLDGLQQFRDATNEELHTLNEEFLALNSKAHNHDNKAVLDSFTRADKTAIEGLSAFKSGVESDIQELHESVSTVIEQAHWHHNLTLLNSLTSAKINKWDGCELQIQSLQDNIMDYQMQMNNRMDTVEENTSSLTSAVQQLRDSVQYDFQSINDEISVFENRLTSLESQLEGVETLLARLVEVN